MSKIVYVVSNPNAQDVIIGSSTVPAGQSKSITVEEDGAEDLRINAAISAGTLAFVSCTPVLTVKGFNTPLNGAYAATQTLDLSTVPEGGIVRFALTGNINLSLQGGVDGKRFTLEFIQDATGSRLVTLNAASFRFGTDVTSYTATTAASKTDKVTCVFNAGVGKADVVNIVKGY